MSLRWGLVGASNIAGEWMIDAIRSQPDHQVVAVLSSDADRAATFAREHAIPSRFTDLQKMLASDIDAVYVSTTNDLHCSQVLASAAAGKHVLCEKPLAMKTADARAMILACRKAGVVMATNHHLRNSGALIAMQQAISDGRIGRPVAARVFHAVYLRDHLQGWRINNPAVGGGVDFDILVHDADTLRFLLGQDPLSVGAVAQSGSMAHDGVLDGMMTIETYGGGIIAQCHVGYTLRHAGTGLEIHGTDGSLLARDVMTARSQGTVVLRTSKGEEELSFEPEPPYSRIVRLFGEAVEGKGPPSATGIDGLWSLAVAEAAQRAARERRIVTIDPRIDQLSS